MGVLKNTFNCEKDVSIHDFAMTLGLKYKTTFLDRKLFFCVFFFFFPLFRFFFEFCHKNAFTFVKIFLFACMHMSLALIKKREHLNFNGTNLRIKILIRSSYHFVNNIYCYLSLLYENK